MVGSPGLEPETSTVSIWHRPSDTDASIENKALRHALLSVKCVRSVSFPVFCANFVSGYGGPIFRFNEGGSGLLYRDATLTHCSPRQGSPETTFQSTRPVRAANPTATRVKLWLRFQSARAAIGVALTIVLLVQFTLFQMSENAERSQSIRIGGLV